MDDEVLYDSPSISEVEEVVETEEGKKPPVITDLLNDASAMAIIQSALEKQSPLPTMVEDMVDERTPKMKFIEKSDSEQRALLIEMERENRILYHELLLKERELLKKSIARDDAKLENIYSEISLENRARDLWKKKADDLEDDLKRRSRSRSPSPTRKRKKRYSSSSSSSSRSRSSSSSRSRSRSRKRSPSPRKITTTTTLVTTTEKQPIQEPRVTFNGTSVRESESLFPPIHVDMSSSNNNNNNSNNRSQQQRQQTTSARQVQDKGVSKYNWPEYTQNDAWNNHNTQLMQQQQQQWDRNRRNSPPPYQQRDNRDDYFPPRRQSGEGGGSGGGRNNKGKKYRK